MSFISDLYASLAQVFPGITPTYEVLDRDQEAYIKRQVGNLSQPSFIRSAAGLPFQNSEDIKALQSQLYSEGFYDSNNSADMSNLTKDQKKKELINGKVDSRLLKAYLKKRNYINPNKPKDSNLFSWFNPKVEEIIYDPKKESYNISPEKQNDNFTAYAQSVAGASDAIHRIFPEVNMDDVQKLSLGVVKAETNYMNNTLDKQGIVSQIKQKLGDLWKYNRHYLNPFLQKIGVDPFVKQTIENKSSNLTKFKLSNLNQTERNLLGIYSYEDLNNPYKAGLASEYLLAKNYDYFQRLQKKYPSLGITDKDIHDLTALSYNQGMSKLYHIGFDPKTGKIAPEELEAIRNMAKPGARIKDYTSTNYKYLGETLGNFLYNIEFPTGHPTYISKVNKAINTDLHKT